LLWKSCEERTGTELEVSVVNLSKRRQRLLVAGGAQSLKDSTLGELLKVEHKECAQSLSERTRVTSSGGIVPSMIPWRRTQEVIQRSCSSREEGALNREESEEEKSTARIHREISEVPIAARSWRSCAGFTP
jgi:hypothetical protein